MYIKDKQLKQNKKKIFLLLLMDYSPTSTVLIFLTRFDVYETLCLQQMLVHKGGQIKNWSGECGDVIPTKLQC